MEVGVMYITNGLVTNICCFTMKAACFCVSESLCDSRLSPCNVVLRVASDFKLTHAVA